ncbi:MAG TPA: S1/P1 nuclease [Burkholderiales bacterium]|nr:S1/P1 nuclease [Burkholderiales bacterium]
MLRLLPVLFALSAPAFAWGPEGHRVVGDIASRYLSARAQAQISELLRNDRLAGGEPSGRRTLGEIANWADEIKDFEWGKRRSSWHYDDIPLCGAAGYAVYCRGGRCASAQLARQIEVLGDPRARPRARNEALKWVVHLIGDIHQPLHAANRGDRGGNLVRVSFFGERDNPPYGSLNLHAIWDMHLLSRLTAERGGEPALVAEPIGDIERSAWEQGSISEWIAESHALARDRAYAPLVASCGERIAGVVELGEAYYAGAAPVVDLQIRKAGVRLARVLNDVLGSGRAAR